MHFCMGKICQSADMIGITMGEHNVPHLCGLKTEVFDPAQCGIGGIELKPREINQLLPQSLISSGQHRVTGASRAGGARRRRDSVPPVPPFPGDSPACGSGTGGAPARRVPQAACFRLSGRFFRWVSVRSGGLPAPESLR